MSSRRNNKKQSVKDGPPPSHPQENFTDHRNFLLRSLNRNDVDLSALVKLNSTLKASKAAIVESCGESVLLDLGIGRLTLIDDELMMKDELLQHEGGGGGGIVKSYNNNNNDDAADHHQQQQHRRVLTPVQKSMCVDFLLRMKLRRKLCNRLARRLNRIAHAMDGEDVAPPPPPKYGDLRLNVDPAAVAAKVEIWKQKEQAKKEIEIAKRRQEEEEAAAKAAAAARQQKQSNEITIATNSSEAHKKEIVDNETKNQQEEGETTAAVVKSDDAAVVVDEQAAKPPKEATEGEDESPSPDESKSQNNNVADDNDGQRNANNDGMEQQAPPVQMEVEKTTSSSAPPPMKVEEGKPPADVMSSSSSVKISSNKIDDLKYNYSSSPLARYYDALKEYDTMYEKIWDPTTKKFKFIAADDDGEGATTEPEYTQIKGGNGIGGAQRPMSLQEREAEHKRWQAAILSRVPKQPTFEDLGLKNRVFCYEARKKRCLDLEQEEDDDDELESSSQRQEEGSKKIKLDPEAADNNNKEGPEEVEDQSAMKVEEKQGSEDKEAKSTDDGVARKIFTGEEDEKDDGNKAIKMEEDTETDNMDIDDNANETDKVKTDDTTTVAGKGSEEKVVDTTEVKKEEKNSAGTEIGKMYVDESSTKEKGDGGEIKKDEKMESEMTPSEDGDTKEPSDQNSGDGEATKENDGEVTESTKKENADSMTKNSDDVSSDMLHASSTKSAEEEDDKNAGVLKKADDESSDMFEADDEDGGGAIEGGKTDKSERTDAPSSSTEPLKREIVDKNAKPDQKKENEKDKDVVDEEEVKPKKPMSLAPIPSFHDQDMARIRLIHSDLLGASIIEHSRKRYAEATRDYNNAFRVSNDVYDRKQKLTQNLNFFMAKSRNDIAKANNDYAMEVAIAKGRWIKQKHEYDVKRAQSVLPSTWGQLAFGTHLLQNEMRRTQCQGIRGSVSSCLADIVDGSMSILEGRAQQQKKFADFKPPPNKTIDKRTGETLEQRTVAVENQLRRQLDELTTKLNANETERERLWKKMMKAKAESEIPQQISGRRGRGVDYSQIPVPALRKSQQHSVSVPARSSVPAYTPPRSTAVSSSQDGASDSKYSAARVRERKSNDGTVAPVSEPKKTREGLYMRPAGRTRKGMQWDAVRGIWVPEGSQ